VPQAMVPTEQLLGRAEELRRGSQLPAVPGTTLAPLGSGAPGAGPPSFGRPAAPPETQPPVYPLPAPGVLPPNN